MRGGREGIARNYCHTMLLLLVSYCYDSSKLRVILLGVIAYGQLANDSALYGFKGQSRNSHYHNPILFHF